MQLKTGDRIGDYEVLGVLGAGGMGSVYKVRNVISDRVEALKLLLPNLVEHPDLKERFLREIKTSASLEHPAIAGLRTAFQSGDMLLMVMEFVDGHTLDARLRQGPLEVAEAVRITASVLDALEFAHSRGVVHRDIKPANIMLAHNGGVKLLDFGIAKATTDKQITVAGTTMGSLYYMSPEQIRGEHVDGRGDLYSLGITLYELTTGKRPFGGESGYAIMAEHLQKQPVPPIEIAPHVPSALSSVILRSLAKQPANRYQTAAEFRQDLISVLSPEEATQIVGRTAPRQTSAPTAAAVSALPTSPANLGAPPAGAAIPAPVLQPLPIQPLPIQPLPMQPPPIQASPLAPQMPMPDPPQAPSANPAPWPAASAMPAAQPKKPSNTLALVMVAIIAIMVFGAVALVFAGSWFFGSSDTTVANAEPSLVQRIGSLFSGSSASSSDTPGVESQGATESSAGSTSGEATNPGDIAANQTALSASGVQSGQLEPEQQRIIPSQSGAPSSSATSLSSPVASRVAAAQSAASKASSAALQSQTAPSSSVAPAQQAESPIYAPTPTTAAGPDPQQLEAARDFFSKLGIRAGTIQESARKLSQEQSSMGVSLRADMRAAMKRMEYLMDQAEASLDRGNLSQASQHMQGAEREIEKLEKFFRI